jgi:hypothetical protein
MALLCFVIALLSYAAPGPMAIAPGGEALPVILVVSGPARQQVDRQTPRVRPAPTGGIQFCAVPERCKAWYRRGYPRSYNRGGVLSQVDMGEPRSRDAPVLRSDARCHDTRAVGCKSSRLHRMRRCRYLPRTTTPLRLLVVRGQRAADEIAAFAFARSLPFLGLSDDASTAWSDRNPFYLRIGNAAYPSAGVSTGLHALKYTPRSPC